MAVAAASRRTGRADSSLGDSRAGPYGWLPLRSRQPGSGQDCVVAHPHLPGVSALWCAERASRRDVKRQTTGSTRATILEEREAAQRERATRFDTTALLHLAVLRAGGGCGAYTGARDRGDTLHAKKRSERWQRRPGPMSLRVPTSST